MKSGYNRGKNFGGRVAHLPQTGRLWEIGEMEEGEKAVRREIKTSWCVAGHGVQIARVVEN